MPRLGPYLTGNYPTTQTLSLNPSSLSLPYNKQTNDVETLMLSDFPAALQLQARFLQQDTSLNITY